MAPVYLLSFSSTEALSHELSGGKGANLARLRQAGFAVPPGVIVSTAAYRAFVQTNRLSQILAEALAVDSTTPLQNLEEISTRIRRSFEAAALPALVA